MSIDSINRISYLRTLYKSQESNAPSEEVRQLQNIKNELKIANDISARDDSTITNAVGSPYLPDQKFYKKEVIFNSPEEVSWKEVKTADEVQKDVETQFVESNKRKLNVL